MLDASFVGRADELSVLLRALDPAMPTRIVSIEGTAGIGKTTLLRQALGVSVLPTRTVVTVSPTSAERLTAWGAVRLLLTGGLADLAAEHGDS
ncbi:MAG TPA: AAA family ATPase, partial [Ilumatobacter sp.]|nr:AAA family ATPase [Ilumatobacter sp.]